MTQKFKVLIVDDSTVILRMLERAFAETDYAVITCADPINAYEMIEDQHFDIVISDIIMPQMDGLTLLRKIKEFNGTIQVIMITGDITINNTLNAFRYGANDIFFKPITDIHKLIDAVNASARKLSRINEVLKTLASGKGK